MPTNNSEVKFECRTRASFNSLNPKNDDTFYVVIETDGTRKLYLGNIIVSGSQQAIVATGFIDTTNNPAIISVPAQYFGWKRLYIVGDIITSAGSMTIPFQREYGLSGASNTGYADPNEFGQGPVVINITFRPSLNDIRIDLMNIAEVVDYKIIAENW